MHHYTKEQSAYMRELTLSNYSYHDHAETFNRRFPENPITITNVKTWRTNHQCFGNRKGYFPKGNVPWNKGTHYYAAGCERTWFSESHLPHNTQEVGTVMIIKDHHGRSYYKIKTAMPKTWKFLHVKVWEDHNGPVPKGSMIRFFDGDSLNCDISNLYMITMRENAIMNHLHIIPHDEESLAVARTLCNLSTIKNARRHPTQAAKEAPDGKEPGKPD